MTSKYRFDNNGTLVDPDTYFLLRAQFPGIGLPPPNDGGSSLADGGYAWGTNDDNQVGTGSNLSGTPIPTPTLVAGGFTPRFLSPTRVGFTSISAPGNRGSVMLDTGNSLYAWGSAGSGVSMTTAGPTPLLKTGSPGVGAWKSVTLGAEFGVGISNSGRLYGWGNATATTPFGAAGTFNATQESSGGVTWTQATVTGTFAILAIKNDGTLWATGLNGSGELGLNDTSARTSWVQVGSDSTWRQVVGGSDHVIALKNDGTIWTWGANTYGQLGLNDTTQRLVPTQVGVLTSWASITAGSAFSGAVRHNGTLWTWGRNVDGQLGHGDTTLQRLVPTQVGTDSNWSMVSAGYNHSMALKTTGTIWAWGSNLVGQLGQDAVSPAIPIPVQVTDSTEWSRVQAGLMTSMAVHGAAGEEVASLQAFYDTPGTYTFVVPQGVTTINALAIGGGGGGMQYSFGDSPEGVGGGGGALSYRNNVAVGPGDVLTVVVGAGGLGNTDPNPNLAADWFGEDGGDSYVLHVPSNTYAAYAEGGQGGASGGGGLSVAAGGQAFVGGGGPLGYDADGGGNGGGSWEGECGGGGAGGYNGNGGTSTNALDNSNPFPGDNGKPAQVGSGGGGAGKSGGFTVGGAGGGGGVGVYVIGADGGGQSSTGQGGFGGSGGQNGQNAVGFNGGDGGLYGGGGGSGDDLDTNNDATTGFGGNGARGCVYITWGIGRTFPSAANPVI